MIKTKYFDIYFSDVDSDEAATYAKFVDNVVEDLSCKFGLAVDNDKYSLYVCENVEKFIELTEKSPEIYQSWMVGNTDFKTQTICILSSKVSVTHTAEALEKVVKHEIVHIVFDKYFDADTSPLWLSEGIALLYAEQINKALLSSVNYPKCENLADAGFYDNDGYAYSGVYVWYLIKVCGVKAFLALYNSEEIDLPEDFEYLAVTEYLKSNK